MSPIEEVRSLFEARLKGGVPNPPGEFHPNDIENRVNNDDYIKRILLHHLDDVKAAADMLWEICTWRKVVNANEIKESNINMDYIKEGGIFPRGRDMESSLLFIFKCKIHVKGSKNFQELKKCIIYWFNRMEREENGRPISLFFDMDGCGLSNMDMELIKYLITLMKFYYPHFLQYIIIYQMPWVLSAAFKVVKTLLPAQAIAKMKFLNKDTLNEVVSQEQALVAWGGKDNYIFEFIPESRGSSDHTPKKVTFAEQGHSQHSPGEMLKLVPNDIIVFKNENDELSGSFIITNMDESPISFKIRTTSPEKFRVRPSSGTLAAGDSQTVTIVVQTGFQLRTVTKDRFLVMSVQIPKTTMTQQELAEVWQKSSGSKVDEYRLKCSFPDKEPSKNGNIVESRDEKSNPVITAINKLQNNCDDLNKQIKTLKLFQMFTIFLTILAVALGYLIYKNSNSDGYCENM